MTFFQIEKMYHFVHCCIDNPTHKMDIFTNGVHVHV